MDAPHYTYDIQTLSDEALALVVQKGDIHAFSVLVGRYEQKLTRYGRKFLSNPENITDLVQDICIKTYRNINEFDVKRSFSSWIYRIAHNTFVNALRKSKTDFLVFVDFDTFMVHPVYEDPAELEKEALHIQSMIEVGLEEIKPKYKEVIILHYFENLAYKDIAEVLKVPVGTVSIRMKRAKEALKKVYNAHGH